ncbi:hypothetical protein GCM10027047_00730 [Rhodococcus aerolatus]
MGLWPISEVVSSLLASLAGALVELLVATTGEAVARATLGRVILDAQLAGDTPGPASPGAPPTAPT